jgi:Mitochondrial ribosomal protein (VAR1)
MLDKYKFNYIFINKLSNLIYKIYNKKIKLNFINLKYNYMNSDIFTQYIIKKSNHTSQNFILKDILKKIRMPFVNKLHKGYRLPNTNNINTLDIIKIKDSNLKIFKNNKVNNKIRSSILKFIKYK